MESTSLAPDRTFPRNGVLTVVFFVCSVLAGVVAVMNFILQKPMIAYIWIAVAILNTINSFFSLGTPFVRVESGIMKYRPALLRGDQIGDLSQIENLDVQKKKVIVQFQSGQTMKIPFSGLNKADRPALIELLEQAAGQG